MVNLAIQGYKKKASRFELCCVRWLFMIPWAIIGGISMSLMGMLLGLLSFINFWSILIAGSRFEAFYENYVKMQKFVVRAGMYFSLASDERPDWHPF